MPNRKFRSLLPEKFSKNLKIGVGYFLWSSITYLNEKKKGRGRLCVECSLYTVSGNTKYSKYLKNVYNNRRYHLLARLIYFVTYLVVDTILNFRKIWKSKFYRELRIKKSVSKRSRKQNGLPKMSYLRNEKKSLYFFHY